MPTIRIAVASTPLTATLDAAVPAAMAAIEEAGRLEARIVCLPETGDPGPPRPADGPCPTSRTRRSMPHSTRSRRRHDGPGVVAIVGTERHVAGGREIVSVVIGADGERIGEQVKTQIDPTEETDYVAGPRPPRLHRRRPDLRDRHLPRGVPLSGDRPVAGPGRRPGRLRAALRDHGRRIAPDRLVRAREPVQREGADGPRARELDLHRPVERVRPRTRVRSPGSSAPDGSLVASLPYGERGVVAADIDLDLATGRLALRWAPDRNVFA